MNNYNQHSYISDPSPLQLLYDVMATSASNWTPKDFDDCEDLAEYTGLDRDEVKLELIEIWLPIFKFKSALTYALDSMRINYPKDIESDFCTFYLEVLGEMKP